MKLDVAAFTKTLFVDAIMLELGRLPEKTQSVS
jgi:hypothetical protein